MKPEIRMPFILNKEQLLQLAHVNFYDKHSNNEKDVIFIYDTAEVEPMTQLICLSEQPADAKVFTNPPNAKTPERLINIVKSLEPQMIEDNLIQFLMLTRVVGVSSNGNIILSYINSDGLFEQAYTHVDKILSTPFLLNRRERMFIGLETAHDKELMDSL